MNRQSLLSLLMLIMSLFLISCDAEASSAENEMKLVPIQLATMKQDVVEHTYIAIGEVVPKNQVDLIIGSGSIEGLFVMPGDLVSKDMALVGLDNNTATSSYTATESQLRTIRETLRSQYNAANDNYLSQKTLYDSGVVSKQSLDQIKNTADNFLRQLNDASVNYTNQLKTLKESVSDRLLTSPIDGKVAAVYIKKGQTVNNQLAISIIDDSQLFVKTFISGDLKKMLNIDDSVTLKLDGKSDDTLLGNIYQINELPDMSSKLFEMLIQVDDTNNLNIGDYTEIEFVIERYEALMIPTESIIRSGMNQYVYTYDNGQVTKLLIDTGLTKGVWIEVKDFYEILQVVVRGQNQLTTGSQVVVVE